MNRSPARPSRERSGGVHENSSSDGLSPKGTPQVPDLNDVLQSTNWVQMLSASVRHRVIADCYERTYRARDVVAHQGEPATSWIGVIDGLLKVSTVTVSGRSVMFTAVPNGAWVGEGSVIKREPRRYDLMALRTSRVIHVPRPTFMWLLEASVDFSRYIIDHLNERTGQFLGMLEVSRLTEPASRVAGSICNLFNPVLYPNAGPVLNISQEELGELSGLSRSTTNGALAKLSKLQLLSIEYGGLMVLDINRLRAFAFSDRIDEPMASSSLEATDGSTGVRRPPHDSDH